MSAHSDEEFYNAVRRSKLARRARRPSAGRQYQRDADNAREALQRAMDRRG